MAKTSPTQRSLAWARAHGASAAVVEKWVAFQGHPAGGVRRDLFGWIDLVVCLPGESMLGVQACAGASAATRVSKIADTARLSDRDLQGLLDWCACRGRLEVWAWAKRGKAGKRKLWTCRRVEVDPAFICSSLGRALPERKSPTPTPRLRLEAEAELFPD